jgi:hypothetical protein
VPVAFAKKAFVGGREKVKREREREREKFASSSYGVCVTIYPKKEKKRGGGRRGGAG